jgi:phosphatidylinositol glycan class F
MASSSPTVSSPSTSSKAPPSQQNSATTTPHTEKAHAIDILPTPVAQTYSHIHPTVLLALYSLRFSSLVSDPVSTLWSDLPLYTGLQVAYVVTCLPQAGSSHQHHSHGEVGSSGDAADVKKTPSSSGKRKRHAAGNKSDTLSQKLTVRHSPPVFFFFFSHPFRDCTDQNNRRHSSP